MLYVYTVCMYCMCLCGRGKNMSTLQQLRYFCALATLKQYTKAANSLFITQPALSNSINSLEKELGVKLFEKHGKELALSKCGELFFNRVNPLLDELEECESMVRQYGSTTKDFVRIGHFYSFSFGYLASLSKMLYSIPKLKDISIEFILNIKNNGVLNDLREGFVDLAFCCIDESNKSICHRSLEYVPVAEQELLFAVHRDDPLSSRESVSLEEIKDYPFIMTDKETHMSYFTRELFASANINPTIALETGEWHAQVLYVSMGAGAGIVPKILNYRNDDVSFIKINSPHNKRTISLAWQSDRKLPPHITLVRDTIIKNKPLIL